MRAWRAWLVWRKKNPTPMASVVHKIAQMAVCKMQTNFFFTGVAQLVFFATNCTNLHELKEIKFVPIREIRGEFRSLSCQLRKFCFIFIQSPDYLVLPRFPKTLR